MLLLTPVATASVLTGEMVHDQIVEQLRQKNLQSNPAIDSARQFPSCPSKVVIKGIFGSWKTVEISCPDTNWRLAVRTNVRESLKLSEKDIDKNNNPKRLVVSLNTSLNKGDILKDTHLSYLKTKKNIGSGVFYKEQEVIGRTLKQQLSVGSIVRARHLLPNWVINKDQIVMIEHRVGNILINAQGIAQEAGQIGQRIWVNNFNSGKKVLCWIKNDKKVTTNAKVY
jgi:flagella basal body P-ring formation protein FlgA